MADPHVEYNAELVADLNDLIQLDRDATEAYTVAINTIGDIGIRDTFVANRAQHQRHVDELAALVRVRGGMAIEMPHITGPMKMAVQAIGGATMRDANVLLALRVVEGQVRDKYARYGSRRWPADVGPVVSAAAADEEAHYRWVLDELRRQGYGDHSLASTVGAAAEALHKMVATPIEAVSKQFMRAVDNVHPLSVMTRRAHERSNDTDIAADIESFRRALRAVEEKRDVEWIVSLFSNDATLSSPLMADDVHGLEGAHEFWTTYRDAFTDASTEFDLVTPAANVVTVQWTTTGTTPAGTAAIVRGITVIEYRGSRIIKLQTVFDPTPLRRA